MNLIKEPTRRQDNSFKGCLSLASRLCSLSLSYHNYAWAVNICLYLINIQVYPKLIVYINSIQDIGDLPRGELGFLK